METQRPGLSDSGRPLASWGSLQTLWSFYSLFPSLSGPTPQAPLCKASSLPPVHKGRVTPAGGSIHGADRDPAQDLQETRDWGQSGE